MPFAILMSHHPKVTKIENWEPTNIIFETGQEANDYAKNENQFNASLGYPTRFRVKPIPLEDPLAWRLREKAKIDSGEYKLPPWGDRGTELFEHIDPDAPQRVRFYASEQDAWRNRYTSMNPGKFIKTYLDPYIPDIQVDEWCAQMGLDMTVSKLKLATKRKDVVKVYTEGPHSCMSYKLEEDCPFHSRKYHPVEVYANSDVAVAYITRLGEITARCLVWPEKKIHGRIYGDSARMKERLKEEGYVENWEGFVGVRLKLLRDRSRIVAPYFDGDCGAIIENEHLVISDKPHIILKNPYGTISSDHCTRCGGEDRWIECIRDEDNEIVGFECVEGCLE